MARRVVAAVLILVSLALLTIYLREDDEGGLHAAQRLGLAVLSPFEVAGERIARPFQDAYGYVSDLVGTKQDTDVFEARIASLEEQLRQYQNAAEENERLRGLLDYVDGARFPDDYRPVVGRVIAQPANAYNQTIVVAAGSDKGITPGSPVVTDEGLVGLVSKVTGGEAQVTLLTDESAAVSAVVVSPQASDTPARGIIEPSPSAAGLVLDRVDKALVVNVGDTVVSSGWTLGDLSSRYPYNIPIGTVTSVGRQDIDLYARVQVEPFVDFDSLAEVVILVKR
jgi:rod shape-determining protein MreC